MIPDPNRPEGRLSVEVEGGDYTLSVRELLTILWRRIWIIILSSVFFVGAAVGVSFLQTPEYEASITILVGQDRGFTETPNDALGIQTLTQTIAGTVNSTRVADAVIQDLDLNISSEDFLENLSVGQVPDTQLVEVSYRDTSANDAQLIVNTVGEEFSEQIAEASPDASAVTAVTWDEATLPEDPVSPNPVRNGILGFAVGLFVGLGFVALIELLDDSWRSPEEIERVSGVPTFGVIPQFDSTKTQSKKRKSSGKSPPKRKESEIPERLVGEAREPARKMSFGETASWPYFGTVLLDRQGKIRKSNPTYARMLGYEDDEVRGEEFVGFATHPDDAEENGRLHGELVEGKRDGYQMEKRLITKEGQILWGQVSVSKIEASRDDEFAFGTVDDITSRKHAEEELRLSEEARRSADARLSAFVERSPFAVRTFASDGQPLMSGGAWNDFWGHSLNGNGSLESENIFEDEIIETTGLHTYVRSAISSGETVETPVLPLARRGNANGDVENAAIESDSRWFRAFITPVSDEAGRVEEVAVALSDVTENKQIEARLEEAREEQRESEKDLEMREKVLKEREERFRSLVEFATNFANGDSSGRSE